MTNKVDNIFSTPQTSSPFAFDSQVAEVFPDMIKRSVPGYSNIIDNIAKFAAHYTRHNSQCYDLGCSLGAASLAMSCGIDEAKVNGVNIIAVDNSEAMLTRCAQHINAFKHSAPIQLIESDIQQITIKNASMVVLNFTLQFIVKSDRLALLESIYQGLNTGGALILSEKITFDDPDTNQLMIDLHHQFKRDNGYSDLEVSQKRNALENVLLPDSLQQHIERLKSIGFSAVNCWLQQYNFVSIIAVK
jgi:tRNA (cmo5U34)-methyltransferase